VLTNLSLNRTDLGDMLWLDQERLIIEAKNENMIVVNPFTHKQELISNELPGLETRHLPTGPWWRVEYSPDLKQVVYYSSSGPALYDVVSKQILWYSTMQGNWGMPGWSPDGQEVVIAAGGQLYLINRSGEAKSMLDENLPNEGAAPTWSPDGQYIAFWNFDDLILYDRKAEQILGLCVKNDWTTKPSLGWSPDGKQFWADGYVESGPKPYAYPILIDLNKWVVYINILEMQNWNYAAPSIWMNSKP
jgi:Tol biopolymer transport system component